LLTRYVAHAPSSRVSNSLPATARRAWLLSAVLLCAAGRIFAQSRPASRLIPDDLRTALRRSGCRVPDAPAVYGRDSVAAIAHVAYQANVRTATSNDWIVVCEHNSRRAVYIYASPARPSSKPLLRLPIAWDPTSDGCEGWIGVADSTWVRAALAHAARDRRPAILDAKEKRLPLHAGILGSLCEGNGALLHYWTGRRWVELPAHWDAS